MPEPVLIVTYIDDRTGENLGTKNEYFSRNIGEEIFINSKKYYIGSIDFKSYKYGNVVYRLREIYHFKGF